MIQPNTVWEVREENSTSGSRKRLCGSRRKQAETGEALVRLLSQSEAAAMMDAPKFKKVACNITNGHLEAVGEVVSRQKILGAMDRIGIPHKGFSALFKIMAEGLRFVDRNLTLKSIPNPFQVSALLISGTNS